MIIRGGCWKLGGFYEFGVKFIDQSKIMSYSILELM
jgi:hypothetical protein